MEFYGQGRDSFLFCFEYLKEKNKSNRVGSDPGEEVILADAEIRGEGRN